MSATPEILNLGTICRCCHADGYFKDLRDSHENNGQEVYSDLLRTTLDIRITPPLIDASYTICDECIQRLIDAAQFKKQVVLCELKFAEYCKNELTTRVLNEGCFKTDATNDIEVENKDGTIEIKFEEIGDWSNSDVKIKNEHQQFNQEQQLKGIKNELEEEPKDGSKEDTKKKKARKKAKPPESIESPVLKTDSGTQLSCKLCGGSYATMQTLKRHNLKFHSINEYSCTDCTETFDNLNDLKTHSKTHRQIICSHCSKEFKCQRALLVHINSHTRTKIFKCDYCSKEFKIKSSLSGHIKGHLGTRKVCVCYHCGLTFNDVTNMTIHIKTVHEKLRPFNCHLCPKTFTAKKHLVVHIRKHTGEKPFSCSKCSNWFYTNWESKNHKCNDHKYRCKVCFKEFSTRGSFAKHVIRSHKGERPHKCSICGKDFTCRYSMRRHELTHSGIKPYGCHFCPTKFSQKSLVKRHVSRVHSKVKKLKNNRCPICKRVVADMQKHNEKCHGNKKFACDTCDKSYAQVAALNRHKRVVHMGVHYKCDYCNKKYQQKNKLVKHHLKVHNVTVKTEFDFEEAMGLPCTKIKKHDSTPY